MTPTAESLKLAGVDHTENRLPEIKQNLENTVQQALHTLLPGQRVILAIENATIGDTRANLLENLQEGSTPYSGADAYYYSWWLLEQPAGSRQVQPNPQLATAEIALARSNAYVLSHPDAKFTRGILDSVDTMDPRVFMMVEHDLDTAANQRQQHYINQLTIVNQEVDNFITTGTYNQNKFQRAHIAVSGIHARRNQLMVEQALKGMHDHNALIAIYLVGNYHINGMERNALQIIHQPATRRGLQVERIDLQSGQPFTMTYPQEVEWTLEQGQQPTSQQWKRAFLDAAVYHLTDSVMKRLQQSNPTIAYDIPDAHRGVTALIQQLPDEAALDIFIATVAANPGLQQFETLCVQQFGLSNGFEDFVTGFRV